MGTKNNPGKFDCYAKAEDDEPIFVLLARDPFAPILISLWIELREMNDAHELRKLDDAYDVARDMKKWKENNPDHGS